MANLPTASQIDNTHLGLQKQALQYSEKQVADKTAAQAKLDAEYSAAGDKVSAARAAYFDAKDNPNVSQAKLEQLQSNYAAAKDERATIGERAEANSASLEKAQLAVDSNKVKVADAERATSVASNSPASADPVMNDVQATKADNIGSNNTVPDGQTVKADSATPQEPTTNVAQSENTPLSTPTQVTVSSENVGTGVVVPEGDTSGTIGTESPAEIPANQAELGEDGKVTKESLANPDNWDSTPINPKEDPFEASRLQAAAAEDVPGPTEQAVISKDDPVVSKEEQAATEAQQANNRAQLAAEERSVGNENMGIASSVDSARSKQTLAVARNTVQDTDWRIRLSLAPGVKYLYGAAVPGDILYPLKGTDGVVFPYTPSITTAYRANYDPLELTHSNYKLFFYKHSNVDDIQLTAEFTAQDNAEANYLLSVIHFFKSVTKMFYGQDGNNGPKAGTPPPLCYINGYGKYQFNEHPVLVTSFSYSLPNDVDYIRAGSTTLAPGQSANSFKSTPGGSSTGGFSLMKALRLAGSRLTGGSKTSSTSQPAWQNYATAEATYVPTKMQIQLTLLPVVTRNDISKNFSLEKYATGELLQGRKRPTGGGIW